MNAPLLAIFDCDGVLVDSEIIAAEVQAELLAAEGIEMEAAEIGARFAGLTWPTILARLSEENEHVFPKDFQARVDKRLDERLSSEVEEIAGVHEMLDELDLPRCICSNSTSARLEMVLDRTGLWDRFRPYVMSAVEIGTKKGKPAPDVFLHACGEFGVEPGRAVVIEDSVHGVAGAVAAGCRVVGFTGGRHTYPGHAEALSEAGAVTVIKRLRDYPATIAALAEWEDA
ncbi:HAD family phosphatase [Aurantimonas sp. Leaf443]|uniref:HAD family hydrolase n=1 Tax=Aurantimonas sp. Leaf443 TaxID=1736378 RepID=UPI0006F2C2D6|nr:HAD family phosphatase [Aurantimonas sp. Leaf443]KQT88084.1 HAD family hydrolase [Aurantimonas sp. Leaf443]